MNMQSNLEDSAKATPRKLRKFPPEPMVVLGGNESFVLIPLTKGKLAIIDCDDVDSVKGYVWSASQNGTTNIWYAKATINGKTVRMHRFLLGLTDRKIEGDHRNGDGLDNRRDNLRVCNRHQNGKNRRKQTNPSTSKYKGVSYDKHNSTWRAVIWCDGKKISVGSFKIELDAAIAYDFAAKKYFKDYASLNILNVIPA